MLEAHRILSEMGIMTFIHSKKVYKYRRDIMEKS